MIQIDEVKSILNQVGIENYGDITESTYIFLDLNIDSITMMTIVTEFENRYDVLFDEDQLDFTEEMTIKDLLDMINSVIDVK